MRRPALVVTGWGVCTPLGHDVDTLWRRVVAGEDGFRAIDRFPTAPLPCRIASCFSAGELTGLLAEAGVADPAMAFAVLAARRALADGGDPDELTLIVATSAGVADLHDEIDRCWRADPDRARRLLDHGTNSSFAARLAELLGLRGPRLAVSTACASGGHALGLAADLLHTGLARRALVVAADSVHPSLLAGFHAAGALSPVPCAPFGPTDGMSLGEGGGAVLLERSERAGHGLLLGWGGSSDAWHPTSPEPRGTGIAASLRAALRDAGLSTADYHNAHGTGTAANDSAEALAIAAVYGDRVPVSSTKSQLGHTQGAAGLLEAIVTWRALQAQVLPPGLRCHPARRLAPPAAVPTARPQPMQVATSHSSAFGGTNVTVVLGRAAPTAQLPHADPSPRRGGPPRCLVAAYLHSVGVTEGFDPSAEPPTTSAGGFDPPSDATGQLPEGVRSPSRSHPPAPRGGSIPPAEPPTTSAGGFDPPSDATGQLPAGVRSPSQGHPPAPRGGSIPPRVPPASPGRGSNPIRGVDRLGQLLTAAARQAGPRPDAAMLIAVADGPQASTRAFIDSRDARGLGGASAAAFARMVNNAATGAASCALQVRGPTLTTWSGDGLQAIVLGAALLSAHPEVGDALCGGVDEVGHIDDIRHGAGRPPRVPEREGAAVVRLSTTPGPVVLAACALGGPDDLPRLLAGAGPADVLLLTDPAGAPPDAVDVLALTGHSPAAAGAWSVARAFHLLTTGQARRVLTASRSRDAGTTVALWVAER